jgi:hypothetical protein
MPEPVVYTPVEMAIADYDVWVVEPGSNSGYNLKNIVKSIEWSYDLDQASEKYVVEVTRTKGIADIVRTGNRVFIYGKRAYTDGLSYGPLKLGFILDEDINNDEGGTLNFSAWDVMSFLTRNKVSHILPDGQETATEFIKRIGSLYNIPFGNVEDTVIKLGKQIYFNYTLYDIFVSVLSYNRAQDGTNRLFMRTNFDKIDLVRKKDPPFIWVLEQGVGHPSGKEFTGNLFGSNASFSREKYRNVVRVYARKDFDTDADDFFEDLLSGVESDPGPKAEIPEKERQATDTDILKYGMLVESIALEENDILKATAFEQAQDVYDRVIREERSGTVVALNINTLRAGDPVYIYDPSVGLEGKYYIKSGTHRVLPGQATMTLNIQYEDVLPEAYKAKKERQTDIEAIFGNPLMPGEIP